MIIKYKIVHTSTIIIKLVNFIINLRCAKFNNIAFLSGKYLKCSKILTNQSFLENKKKLK